ncbi:MAG: autoinducer binding domain-containing protein [Kordiimonadaceae bacterium]|nr:autoinducer binding domain-containing protein [Kordiimonadaceae bacterium]
MQVLSTNNKHNYELFLNYIKKLQFARSIEALDPILSELCDFLDLDGFTWFHMNHAGQVIELDTRPLEWKKKYDDGLFIYSDPIAQITAVTNQPFIWDQALKVKKLSPKEWSVMNQGQEYGLSEGINFPIHDAQSNIGSLNFYSDDLTHIYDVWSEYQTLLSHVSFLCHTITNSFGHLNIEEIPSLRQLSRAEAEVLTLAAQGWRSGNIADHLYISESAVKKRAQSAFRKLGVRTMSQATVAAVLRREISPYGLDTYQASLK